MKTPSYLAWFLVAVLVVSGGRLQARTWTNAEGVKIQADYVKTEGDNVVLRLANGKSVSFPQAKLSEEDREFIKTAASAKPPANANRKAKWLTTMDKAKDEAKQTGLPILALFTGTSWCPYCIKLEKEVFDKKEFKEFANQNLVLLLLDYEPGGKAKNRTNAELLKEFRVSGFPTYFLCDAEGKPKAANGYQNGISPESFAAWVKQVAP